MQFSRTHPSPGREFKGSAPGGSYCPSALPSTAQSKGGEIFGIGEVEGGLLLLTQEGIAGTTKSNGPGRRCKGQQEAEEGRESLTPRGDGPDFVTPAEGSSRFYPMGQAPGLCWRSPTTHRRENASPHCPLQEGWGRRARQDRAGPACPRTSDGKPRCNREIKGGGEWKEKDTSTKINPKQKARPPSRCSKPQAGRHAHRGITASSFHLHGDDRL